MKEKISISIILIIFLLGLAGNGIFTIGTLGVFAQSANSPKNVSPRTVLAEIFVQEGCLTCPTAEFCLEDLAWEYGTTKLILVEMHLWGDGYDSPETNARYNWYVGDGKKGTPDVFINGLTKRLQGLACDCMEGNYECYKDAINEELTRPSLLEVSAIKTPHPNPLPQGEREEDEESPQGEREEGEESPQGEREEGEESPQGEREEGEESPQGEREEGEESPQGEREEEREDNQVVEEAKGEDKERELVEEKVLKIIIEGTVKNVSNTPLKDLAVCGMVSKEGDESGLYNYIQDIFPFQNIPTLLPENTFSFKYIREISFEQDLEDDKDKKNTEKEITPHLVIFVQNIKTKEVLQALYIE